MRRYSERVQFRAGIFSDKLGALDLVVIGKPRDLAFEAHQAAVDAVDLVDQRFNTIVVQFQGVDVLNHG